MTGKTPEELKAFVQTLRDCGVTKYKGEDGLEIELGAAPPPPLTPDQIKLADAHAKKALDALESVKSVFTMRDGELMNHLFPEPAEYNPEASS